MLRELVQEDLPLVLSWRNQDDVRKYMYTSHIISWSEHYQWYIRQKDDPAIKVLIFELNDEPVGVVMFTDYTGSNGTAFWSFYSGDQSRRGVGKKLEIAALDYAFNVLRLRKLNGEVLSFNKKVLDFHIRHGFTHEGTFREAYERDGQYHDVWRIGMLRKDWELVRN